MFSWHTMVFSWRQSVKNDRSLNYYCAMHKLKNNVLPFFASLETFKSALPLIFKVLPFFEAVRRIRTSEKQIISFYHLRLEEVELNWNRKVFLF